MTHIYEILKYNQDANSDETFDDSFKKVVLNTEDEVSHYLSENYVYGRVYVYDADEYNAYYNASDALSAYMDIPEHIEELDTDSFIFRITYFSYEKEERGEIIEDFYPNIVNTYNRVQELIEWAKDIKINNIPLNEWFEEIKKDYDFKCYIMDNGSGVLSKIYHYSDTDMIAYDEELQKRSPKWQTMKILGKLESLVA